MKQTMNEEMDPQDQIKIEALLRDLNLMRESRCSGCGVAVCGHETLMSFTMGFKDAPQCMGLPRCYYGNGQRCFAGSHLCLYQAAALPLRRMVVG